MKHKIVTEKVEMPNVDMGSWTNHIIFAPGPHTGCSATLSDEDVSQAILDIQDDIKRLIEFKAQTLDSAQLIDYIFENYRLEGK